MMVFIRNATLSFSIFLGVLLGNICFASYIKIDTYIDVSVEDTQTMVDFKITNSGDETAHQVELQAQMGTEKFSSTPLRTLIPGNSFQERFPVANRSEFSRWIIPLKIRYKDANLFPFSALSYADIKSSSHDELSLIHCKVSPLQLRDKGDLLVTVKSLDHNFHKIKVRIISPNELTVTPAEKFFMVPEASDAQLTFEVTNFSALVPSTYTILCIVSEKRKRGWYEDVFKGHVRIASSSQSEHFFSSPYLWWGTFFLALIFVLCQFQRKRT